MRYATFAAALSFALLPSLAAADSITVHNTGVDASDVLVASGAQTSFWVLSAEPGGATEAIGSNPFRFNCCYFSDTSTAAWVSPGRDGNAGVQGVYTYDLVVDLAGLNPATASISGTFGTDNDGSISVNNAAPAATTGFSSFGAPTAFTINSGFVAGVNTIHLKVNNGGDPTAFFVSFTSATANPGQPFVAPTQTPMLSWQMLALLALVLAVTGLLVTRKVRLR